MSPLQRVKDVGMTVGWSPGLRATQSHPEPPNHPLIISQDQPNPTAPQSFRVPLGVGFCLCYHYQHPAKLRSFYFPACCLFFLFLSTVKNWLSTQEVIYKANVAYTLYVHHIYCVYATLTYNIYFLNV